MLGNGGYDAGLVVRARVGGLAEVLLRQGRSARVRHPPVFRPVVLLLPLLQQVLRCKPAGLDLVGEKATNAHLRKRVLLVQYSGGEPVRYLTI